MHRTLPISSIKVRRDDRQRRTLVDIESLAASIARVGLINAIVIDSEGYLIAGERRLEAVRSLGWDSISTQTLDDLDEATAQAIELEENVKRHDLSWKDECLAVYKYHHLRLSQNPEHTLADSAYELSLSASGMGARMAVQEEILAGNELVINADKYSVAKNITVRARERKAAMDQEEITAVIFPDIDIGSDPLTRANEEFTAIAPDKPDVPLLNADFNEWIRSYDGPRYNFLHCDFPYGINADKHHQGAAKYFRGYADSPDVYWTLIAALGDNIDRLVAESCHLVFWFSMDYYTETKLALEQMGWKVNPFPLIWYKSDNTGILPDPNRGPRRIYETALMGSRGDRKIVQPVGNIYPAPVVKDVHMSQKSLPMLQHFFRMFVDESTRMLDPTCGSGMAVKAAQLAGAKHVLGIERDPDFFHNAVEAWNAT